MGVTDQAVNQNAETHVLEEERTDFNPDGQKEKGFASAVVPTLEEKTVAEKRPPKEQTEDTKVRIDEPGRISDDGHQTRSNDTPNGSRSPNGLNFEPRTDEGGLSGVPAMAKSSSTNSEPPSRSLKSDPDEEQKAPGERETLRDNLESKSGRRHAWTVPTQKPRVGPDDFEDPISDAFWKNIWVASAVHNVSNDPLYLILFILRSCCTDYASPHIDGNIPEGIPRHTR